MRNRNLFWNTYKDIVDSWTLFFNGDDNYELIANEDQIFIDELYNNFINGQIYFQLPDGTITQEIPKEYRKVG